MDFSAVKHIDWMSLWEITKDYVLPNTGTIVISIILCGFLGLVIAITYIVILSRKKVFKRLPKYYNWAVKLYIPLLFVGIVFVSIQFGFVRGVYKILDNNRVHIVNDIYDVTLAQFFKSEQDKEKFIEELKLMASETQEGAKTLSKFFELWMHKLDTGNSLVNATKDKLTNYVVNNYGDDIYTLSVYALLQAAGSHANLHETLTYDEFKSVMDVLLTLDHQEIEQSLKAKLDQWCASFLKAQYHSIAIPIILLLVIIMAIPLVEYFVYKTWIEKKYLSKISNNLNETNPINSIDTH